MKIFSVESYSTRMPWRPPSSSTLRLKNAVISATRFGVAAPKPLSEADVDAALKGAIVPPPPPVDQSVGYTPVYYPGTTRESDAQPITLGTGEGGG